MAIRCKSFFIERHKKHDENMIGRVTIGDLGIAAFPGSCLLQEDAMWLSNRGPLRFARQQEGHQTAEMVAGKLQQQQSVDGT